MTKIHNIKLAAFQAGLDIGYTYLNHYDDYAEIQKLLDDLVKEVIECTNVL